jgi:hypothetical protein
MLFTVIAWLAALIGTPRALRVFRDGSQRPNPRIAEIMRAGAERAEVTVEQVVRELKLLGFSDIRKVVSWRNEVITLD